MIRRLATIAIMAMSLCAASHADTLTLRGTSIAMPVTIDRIEAGRVFYTERRGEGQTGRRVYRPLNDIEHIVFAGLPHLADAAKAIDEDRYHDALPHLMHALLHAETDVQRIWIHSLLARAHDVVGQYVQSCGHFAAVVLLEDHVYWRGFAPVSEPNEVDFAAAVEARALLLQAQQSVTHPQLRSVLAQLIQRVEPIHSALAETYTGPPIQPGSTVSGISREAILSATAPAIEEAQATVDPAPPPAETVETGLAAIERLIETERWDEAVAACRQIAQQPPRRDIAQFLHLYGRALAGAGRPRDAAVMFTQCAILHRGSPHASLSLIETALIYRDTFDRRDVSLRLLDRAEEEEAAHNRADVLQRIAAVRRSLE